MEGQRGPFCSKTPDGVQRNSKFKQSYMDHNESCAGMITKT